MQPDRFDEEAFGMLQVSESPELEQDIVSKQFWTKITVWTKAFHGLK
jgi:hypothetical protein